jgi:hypothetical protein
MPPKRKRSVKLERPPSSPGESDSDSSSIVSDTPFFRTRQSTRAVKLNALKYSALHVDALLSLIVGVLARLSDVVTALRYEDVVGTGRIVRESVRVCSSALDPLSVALDELIAIEDALDDRLHIIARSAVRSARRAALPPQP